MMIPPKHHCPHHHHHHHSRHPKLSTRGASTHILWPPPLLLILWPHPLLLSRNCAAHPEGPHSSSQGRRVPRLCLRSPISCSHEKSQGSPSSEEISPPHGREYAPRLLGSSISSPPLPLPPLSSLQKLRLEPDAQSTSSLSGPIKNLPLTGKTHYPSPASSLDHDFNCQNKFMQIGAKLKICSSLLLVPRVPCWGIFNRLRSSEAKEERGDRWSHAFLQ